MGVRVLATPPAEDATNTRLRLLSVHRKTRLNRVYSKHVSMVSRGNLLAMRVAAEVADQRGWFTVATRESFIAPRTKNDSLWASGLPGVGNHTL
jgi:hypothetical protein